MNIIQVFQQFPTQEACIEHLEKARWGDTPKCVYCGSENVYRLTGENRRTHRHHCNACRKSFSVLVGTLFEDTRLELQKWFLAISLILNAKKGISARQLARDLEVNKDTAWRIAMKIRDAMKDQGQLLVGIIEMDGMYVGGKPRKRNRRDDDDPTGNPRGRGTSKTPVVGMIERNGRVKTKKMNKGQLTAKFLNGLVREHVEFIGSVLITDQYSGYNKVSNILKHYTVNHDLMYANGETHTNCIESYWALVKRGIVGQFHKVSIRYLDKYLGEFAYRFNARHQDASYTFASVVRNMLSA